MISASEWSVIALSLRVALVCTALVVVPGIVVGYVLARFQFRGRAIVDALIHLPLVLPPVVVGYFLLVSLGRNGWLGAWLDSMLGWTLAFTWQGAAVASAVMAFPLMVRSVRLSVEQIDPQIEATARSLGAGRLDVFCSITLPLALPGIFAGLSLAFARSLGEFGATITFAGNIPDETRTLPLAIYSLLQVPGGEASAYRLVVLSVLVSIAALLLSEYLQQRMRKRSGGRV
ncbi:MULTISPECIES: molybdate ABC transporter permease subunit [unclassified Lentimonas]|uniref:molybdate ABC transporter permease subunit n=1 Tax=unclassified Lentimonas TaxID=2630993 RepID=UPI001326D166|nr:MULTISPECIES: molybdate ABC transporter permease subunit [unclassified Lentimonas]CAA6694994.1 Molybdenum transport system permease protein ModB (TC 3.A.1.8.1) [Lentimonas sp. CC19]CAA6695360.1 Molybdenum transport system permease protein ModB (TC 3.A.1.8.1) [Lentimonas sp. CC10]CAA7072025.1 Molybdenum transport system permease protein ModB (TC 3.A.1.8.1) [Lentimonas sp. CC11]